MVKLKKLIREVFKEESYDIGSEVKKLWENESEYINISNDSVEDIKNKTELDEIYVPNISLEPGYGLPDRIDLNNPSRWEKWKSNFIKTYGNRGYLFKAVDNPELLIGKKSEYKNPKYFEVIGNSSYENLLKKYFEPLPDQKVAAAFYDKMDTPKRGGIYKGD